MSETIIESMLALGHFLKANDLEMPDCVEIKFKNEIDKCRFDATLKRSFDLMSSHVSIDVVGSGNIDKIAGMPIKTTYQEKPNEQYLSSFSRVGFRGYL